MKIFAVFANVNLIKKPIWLDEFRQKYDKSYQLHITLRSPCFIEEENISGLKESVASFFNHIKIPNHKIEVNFNGIMRGGEEQSTVMFKTECPELIEIQKKLFNTLSDYPKFVKDKYKIYGENFEPHITIGRNIPLEEWSNAMEYFKSSFECIGEITEIVLITVKEDTPEEAKNILNQTIYKL